MAAAVTKVRTSVNSVKFRRERFIESNAGNVSLIKIGEYVRTPLYEPSIRAMRTTLSEVRNQLELDRKASEEFNQAWKAAVKVYNLKSSYLSARFKEPSEYCIALICFTLHEPYSIYNDFNRKCQQLVRDSWADFPYKGLFYLLIQAEMRLRVNDDYVESKTQAPSKGVAVALRHPFTITDLDYSIEEEKVEELLCLEDSVDVSVSASASPLKQNVDTRPKNNTAVHRVFRGYDFAIDEMVFQPRNLVAFSQLMPATLDGGALQRSLEEKGSRATLVEIDQVSWSSRYIASLSMFPVEKEVMIWPWIKFYVEERKMIGNNLEKIVLKPTSQSFIGNHGM